MSRRVRSFAVPRTAAAIGAGAMSSGIGHRDAGDRVAVVVEHRGGDGGEPGRDLARLGGVAAPPGLGRAGPGAPRARSGPSPVRSVKADRSGKSARTWAGGQRGEDRPAARGEVRRQPYADVGHQRAAGPARAPRAT